MAEAHRELPVGTIVDGKVPRLFRSAPSSSSATTSRAWFTSPRWLPHIDTPAQVVKVGQDVKVKVMDINPTVNRISLSMKAAAHDLGFEVEVETIQALSRVSPKQKAAALLKPATEEAAE